MASSTISWHLHRSTRLMVALIVLVVVAVTSVVAAPASHASVASPGFHCVPYSKFPDVRPGHHARVSTSFDGFGAVFTSSLPASASTTMATFGMALHGTLKVESSAATWTLARPNDVANVVINDLCLIRFAHERYPAVLIEGFTGGAHCCEEPVIYLHRSSPSGYVKVVDMTNSHFNSPVRFDINDGFVPRRVGGRVFLLTQDDHFAYTFGCYACTPMPLRLDSVSTKGLRDVTSSHLSVIATQAAQLWNAVAPAERGGTGGPFGVLAAWTADECVLGRGASAWSEVLRLQSKGVLSDAAYHAATSLSGSFVAQLRPFLVKNGYCSGQLH